MILAMRQDGEAPAGIPFNIVKKHRWNLTDKLRYRLGDHAVSPKAGGKSVAKAARRMHDEMGLDALVMEDTFGWAAEVKEAGIGPVLVTLRGPWLLHQSIQSQGNHQKDACRSDRELLGYAAADGIISLSRNILEEMQKRTSFGDKPIAVIPNSIRTDTPPVREDADQILFVGRFDAHKGGDTVIDAFALLVRERPEARMTFVGPDRGLRLPSGRRLSLEEKLATLDARTRAAITVLGQQSTAQVIRLRQTHPIALMGSRFEVFGNVILEAMVASQAIVATSAGGTEEMVEDGASALLVPPDDPARMSEALRRLLDSPSLRLDLGQTARRRVEAEFSPQVIARQTVAFAQSILAER